MKMERVFVLIKSLFFCAISPIFGSGATFEWKFVSGTFSGDKIQACYREDIVSERRMEGYSIKGCNFHIFDIDLAKGTAGRRSVSISNILKFDYYNDVRFVGYLSNRLYFCWGAPWYQKASSKERLGFINLSNLKVVSRSDEWPGLIPTYDIWQDDGNGKLVGHLYFGNGNNISAKSLAIRDGKISEYSGDKISELIMIELSTAHNGKIWRSFGEPSYGVYSMRCKNSQDLVETAATNLCMSFAVLENREGSVRELWRTRIPGWFREAIFVHSSDGKKWVVMNSYHVAVKNVSVDNYDTKRLGAALFSEENGITIIDNDAEGILLCRNDCQVGVMIKDLADSGKPIFSERLFKKSLKLIVYDGRNSDIIPKHVEIEIK